MEDKDLQTANNGDFVGCIMGSNDAKEFLFKDLLNYFLY